MEHLVGFREGQGFANQATKPLSQGAIQSLDVIGFALTGQPFHPQQRLVVREPQVSAECSLETLFWRQRQTVPEPEGSFFAAADRRLKASALSKTSPTTQASTLRVLRSIAIHSHLGCFFLPTKVHISSSSITTSSGEVRQAAGVWITWEAPFLSIWSRCCDGHQRHAGHLLNSCVRAGHRESGCGSPHYGRQIWLRGGSGDHTPCTGTSGSHSSLSHS